MTLEPEHHPAIHGVPPAAVGAWHHRAQHVCKVMTVHDPDDPHDQHTVTPVDLFTRGQVHAILVQHDEDQAAAAPVREGALAVELADLPRPLRADRIDAALQDAWGAGWDESRRVLYTHLNPVNQIRWRVYETGQWAARVRRDVAALSEGYGSCGTTRTARAIRRVSRMLRP